MIQTNDDTIAAISTAMTDAGIGIIRVSGQNAISHIAKFYTNAKNEYDLENHGAGTIKFGYINDENGNIIDEVMVSVMKAPHSYTKENVVEINCHGGMIVMQKILSLITKDENNCRLAEPGEFTKRAFLNGRIDLTKAEAIMDIISAKSEFALKNSEKILNGKMKDTINSMREKILYEMAYIESALDDPENYDLTNYSDRLEKNLKVIMDECKKLIDTSDEGKLRTCGLATVIIGKPNSGKSSLLNILTGEETAIVTDIAGTTRDVIEHDIKIDDLLLHVIDTAGIRESSDKIEQIGVEKAKKYAADADLILYMVDSTKNLDDEDLKLFDSIKDKKTIILLNKSDRKEDIILDENIVKEKLSIAQDENIIMISTSMKDMTGIDKLKEAIGKLFLNGSIVPKEELYVTNIRHKKLLENTFNSLTLVQKSIDDNVSEDFYTIDLSDAYKNLGEILGIDVSEDLVNEIFSKFCMGK